MYTDGDAYVTYSLLGLAAFLGLIFLLIAVQSLWAAWRGAARVHTRRFLRAVAGLLSCLLLALGVIYLYG